MLLYIYTLLDYIRNGVICYASLNIASIYPVLISATCLYVEMISMYVISNCILSAVIVSLFILYVQQFIKI